MSDLTCMIVDDERAARDELEEMLVDHCPEVHVLAKVSSVQQAREAMATLEPDVLFLDVKMPGEDGFALLKHVDTQRVAVIFVTAYDKYAVEAFKVRAQHYLIKPCRPEELLLAVERVKEQKTHSLITYGDPELNPMVSTTSDLGNHHSRLVIMHRTGFKVLKTQDILYLESSGNYTVFHTASGSQLLASRHLGYFEPQLPSRLFLRIHRSYVINLDRVEAYESNHTSHVTMEGGQQLEISKRKLKELMSLLEGVY